MTILNKILTIALIVAILGAIGFVIYEHFKMSSEQTAINASITSQQTLLDNTVRAQSQLATKQDVTNFATANNVDLKEIEADLNSIGSSLGQLTVGTIKTSSGPTSNTNLPSTNATPVLVPSTDGGAPQPAHSLNTTVKCDGQDVACPNQDPNNYLTTIQTLSLNETFNTGTTPVQVGIGQVSFNGSSTTPWAVNLNQRNYTIDVVENTDTNGKNTFYTKLNINSGGTNTVIPTTSTFLQQVPTKSIAFNPQVFLGADISAVLTKPAQADGTFSGGVSIASYGVPGQAPNLVFPIVSVGYSVAQKTVNLVVAPINLNVGNALNIQMMRNTYIGPVVSYNPVDNNWSIGAGVRVSL